MQEVMQLVFGAIRRSVNGKITEDNKTATAKKFGRGVEQMCGIAFAFDVGSEVENFPSLCHQIFAIKTQAKSSAPMEQGLTENTLDDREGQ